jgi:hypothetical protein
MLFPKRKKKLLYIATMRRNKQVLCSRMRIEASSSSLILFYFDLKAHGSGRPSKPMDGPRKMTCNQNKWPLGLSYAWASVRCDSAQNFIYFCSV